MPVNLRAYLYAIGAAIALSVLGLLKYLGSKVKRLEKDVDTANKNTEAAEEQIKKTITEIQLKDKMNEIDKEIIKSKPSDVHNRLSAFNRD